MEAVSAEVATVTILLGYGCSEYVYRYSKRCREKLDDTWAVWGVRGVHENGMRHSP